MARAPYKLYQVKDANAELVKQDEELAALRPLKTENEKLKADLTAAESAVSEATSQLQADLKAKESEITLLRLDNSNLAKAKADAETARDAAVKAKTDAEASVETKAANRAVEICASQGVKAPLVTKPSENPATPPKPSAEGTPTDRAASIIETQIASFLK